MTREITFYVDYRSPFAYLAKTEAFALEQEFDVRLDWLPFALDLQGIYGGEVEERAERHWRKVKYLYMDARRLASKQGLTVRGTRKLFDPTLAHCGMLFAKSSGLWPAYHHYVLERFWKRELEIEEMPVMRGVIAALGGDPDAYERYATGPGPAEYRAIVAAAEARGVFGVPTFILDGELFWGTERIEMLRERLRGAPRPSR